MANAEDGGSSGVSGRTPRRLYRPVWTDSHSFTSRELRSLTAFCDALLPRFPGHTHGSAQQCGDSSSCVGEGEALLRHGMSDMQPVANDAAGLMTQRLKPAKVRELRRVLWLLSTWVGTLLLAGWRALSLTFPFVHTFADLPRDTREAVLRSWVDSRSSDIRLLFKGLKSFCAAAYTTKLNDKLHNPVLDAMGYSVPWMSNDAAAVQSNAAEADGRQHPMDAAKAESSIAPGLPESEAGTVDAPQQPTAAASNSRSDGPLGSALVDAAAVNRCELGSILTEKGFRVLAGLQRSVGLVPEVSGIGVDGDESEVMVVSCDAVVVGSGCGGSVVASQLAAVEGKKVLVLEKGRYYRHDDFSQLEAPSMSELYETGGFLATEDGVVSILSGTSVGGGSTVNWSASFRTPNHVREEWSSKYGLQQFTSEEYDKAMDAVCERIGVNDSNTVHNLSNTVLERGCQKLGYPCEPIPRNAPPPHACGWCMFGCRDGGKQSTPETFLADAAACGAVILSSVRVDRVMSSPSSLSSSAMVAAPQAGKGGDGTGLQRKQRVEGVVAFVEEWHPWQPEAQQQQQRRRRRLLVVEAPLVVASCGSIQTAGLLLRSNLNNPNIGSRLRLHPALCTWGYFPEAADELGGDRQQESDQVVIGGRNPEGGIMTLFSKVVANWDSTGYGALIEAAVLHPGLGAAALPWQTRAQYERRLRTFHRTAAIIVLCRDKSFGRVRLDSQGSIVIDYEICEEDKKSQEVGVEVCLRILHAAGATELGPYQGSMPSFEVQPGTSDADFERYLLQQRASGMPKHDMPVFTAHQMGSCPMGTDADTSAVDKNGETWDVSGLFVADASVFPSPSGVNPMVTVESVAFLIGARLAERLKGGEFTFP